MNNQSSTYSWTVVIIALIVFWPVGVFLLIGKLSNDRTANFGGGSGIVKFVGVVLLVFGAFGGFAVFSGDSGAATGGIIMIIIFALPGFWLIKKSKTIKNSGNTNREYINLIVNNQVREIHEIARRLGVSQDKVIKDVNGMINRGMLGRARLNLNTGKIEFPKPAGQRQQQSTAQRSNQGAYRPSTPHRDVRGTQRPPQRQARPVQNEYKPFQPKTIRCKSCSANNFVESLPATCDYCGSSLHE